MDEERYMKKCAHCGEPLAKRDKVCPRCGAEVETDTTPKTIYELRWFCAQHNMPLAQMRFFLGEDYEGPRAFGVYQDDDGDFVVYKNKADGTRAVRYRGPDEAHAVHEIYQKLLSEIAQRKGGGLTAGAKTRGQYQTRSQQPQRKTRRRPAWIPPLVILMILTVVMTASSTKGLGSYMNNFKQKIALEMPAESYMDIFSNKVIPVGNNPGHGYANVTLPAEDTVGALPAQVPYELQLNLADDCADERFQANLTRYFADRSVKKYRRFPEILTEAAAADFIDPADADLPDSIDVTVGLDYTECKPCRMHYESGVRGKTKGVFQRICHCADEGEKRRHRQHEALAAAAAGAVCSPPFHRPV